MSCSDYSPPWGTRTFYYNIYTLGNNIHKLHGNLNGWIDSRSKTFCDYIYRVLCCKNDSINTLCNNRIKVHYISNLDVNTWLTDTKCEMVGCRFVLIYLQYGKNSDSLMDSEIQTFCVYLTSIFWSLRPITDKMKLVEFVCHD